MKNLLAFLLILSCVYFIPSSQSYAGTGGMGACCTNYPSGDCDVTTSMDCQNIEGDGFFEGETCEPNPCEAPPDSTGDCCMDTVEGDTTGCNDSECEATVCAQDGFCCLVDWDSICISEAESLCGNLCSGGPSGPIAVVPTMGQWGMIISTVLLGFFAVIALRRKREHNT